VLYLHEVHKVAGVCEHEFEAAFRDRFMPALAEGDDARLLWFAHHAHGTGRAYQVVTLTGIRDGAAWEELMRRVQTGDLREWAADVDRLRHDVTGKVLVPLPWSPLTDTDLAAVPVEDAHHGLSLYMEDTAWPHEGMLDDYLEAARSHYAPSLTEPGRGRGFLELQAVFQTAWGTGRRREVVLWQKVKDPSRITPLVTSEVPDEHRAPGTWMHDALRVRDDWESRLLRTTSWSPLF
jgi:hypothetical protein